MPTFFCYNLNKGEIKYIAVTIGNNGYIVGANLRKKLK